MPVGRKSIASLFAWPSYSMRSTNSLMIRACSAGNRTSPLGSNRARAWVRSAWLPRDAKDIDGGEFYAQLKAPTRVRDMTTGELRYVWQETSGLDHYRHAHAYDHLAGLEYVPPRIVLIQ